uniref:Uncharacterized protein n=1 Tax=Ascaris lumbricoides TaxID=6252 RepID=A0A0M3IM73_ASCLU
MDTGRCSNRERVERIQATDSLSTVPPNTILSFASSKVSITFDYRFLYFGSHA